MRSVETSVSARRPRAEGARFQIDTVPWHPAPRHVQSMTERLLEGAGGSDFVEYNGGGGIDLEDCSLAEDKVVDWPMVYILTNQSEAYVGQTRSVLHRMEQHSANREKRAFDEVSLIYSEQFNMSVITDYEHRLIRLMSADGVYRLTNKNDGMQDGNYFSRDEYARMFEDLWEELRGRRIADKPIAEIEESELFKYSPYKSLNHGQQGALARIMEAIRRRAYEASPIVVEGMPGTGKTVLAVYLLKMLKDMPEFKDANIRLVEPMPSLRKTLQRVLRTVGGLSSKDVIGPGDVAKKAYGFTSPDEKAFDVLLVDEAHRLKQYRNIVNRGSFKSTSQRLGLDYETCTEVDWIMSQAKIPVFFYDPLQAVKPSSPNHTQFMDSVGIAPLSQISLSEQMRCGGGVAYLDYVRDIIWGEHPQRREFSGYDFVLHEDMGEFLGCFEETLGAHNLTRLLAGFAWPWVTKGKAGNPPEVFDIEIDGVRLKWNSVQEGWVDKGVDDALVAHEVGCIHTIQGYDLSCAFVIVGPDLAYDPATDRPVAVRESYFDKNGKNGTTDEELLGYIRNIYYVLMTRGIESTHLYVCDEGLREYFRRYV